MATKTKSETHRTTDPAPQETRLDNDVTKPATVAVGDAPADTTDPTERASTVGGDKAAAAAEGHLTVNAVLPVDEEKWRKGLGLTPGDTAADDSEGRNKDGHRIETYPMVRPDGTEVTVTHNIDTGETSVS